MILGYEIAGAVAETGQDVTSLRIGQRVAVNPSLSCGVCAFCRKGLHNHCSDMRFYGSAMRTPHVDGRRMSTAAFVRRSFASRNKQFQFRTR